MTVPVIVINMLAARAEEISPYTSMKRFTAE